MRLINADELLQEIETLGRDAGFYKPIYDGFINTIKHSQAVDAEPVRHGQWETKEYTTEDSFDDWIVIHHEEVCSECGKGQGERSKFCPNCGAKMDGEAE